MLKRTSSHFNYKTYSVHPSLSLVLLWHSWNKYLKKFTISSLVASTSN